LGRVSLGDAKALSKATVRNALMSVYEFKTGVLITTPSSLFVAEFREGFWTENRKLCTCPIRPNVSRRQMSFFDRINGFINAAASFFTNTYASQQTRQGFIPRPRRKIDKALRINERTPRVHYFNPVREYFNQRSSSTDCHILMQESISNQLAHRNSREDRLRHTKRCTDYVLFGKLFADVLYQSSKPTA
jgi:hypothetical protein